MSSVSRQQISLRLHLDLAHVCSWGEVLDRTDPFENRKRIAALSLIEGIFKKFEDTNDLADQAAIAKFLQTIRTVELWELPQLPSWDEELLGEIKLTLDNFFHPRGGLLIQDYYSLFNKGDVGPGASLMGVGGDFYSKMFSSPLTVTNLGLYESYKAAIATLPTWNLAENHRLATCGGPKVVEGNRMSCVPKNVDISRTICTEPTLNMWYQLGLGNILADRLKSFFGIDLSRQPEINREMARLGSLSSDEFSFSTIDLESASDSIGIEMLYTILPPWVVSVLIDLRSPTTLLPDGRRVELPIMSTMGNGYTFPLQTLIFAAIVSSVYRQEGISSRSVGPDFDGPSWSVFGDDIIVYRKVYNRVCRMLSILGFKVNPKKSFCEGPFRESCGSDFYNGFNVRPVYIRKLDSAQDIYSAYNRLARWSKQTGISLQSTLHYLLKKARFIPVPDWEADDSGFKVPFCDARRHIHFDHNGSIVYKAVETRHGRIVMDDSHIRVPRGQRRRSYNPDGLLTSVVKGEFRGGALVPRQRNGGKPRMTRKIALNWDYPPVPGHIFHSFLQGNPWYQVAMEGN